MARLHSVLLLDSDLGTIKDVTCSLRLVNIPVTAVPSVAEAVRSLEVVKPSLVIARRRVADSETAAIDLVDQVASATGTPVVLLVKPGEEQLFDGTLERFDGVIHLPVEFPVFTYKVQELLGKLAQKGARAADVDNSVKKQEDASMETLDELPDPDASVGTQQAASQVSMKPSNLSVAYDIQLRVIGELSKTANFATADVEEVSRLVSEATARVCKTYEPRKIFGY